MGAFYYPRYIEAKKAGKETAWDYVEDVPGLPRVLVIGDSISRGYTMPLRHELMGKVNLHRAPQNCSSTNVGIKKLDVWLGDGDWDLITFNFGIHDRRASNADYQKRLMQIVRRLQATDAKLLWVNTTPVPEGARQYVAGSVECLNEVAAAVMKQQNIPVLDMNQAITPLIARYQLPENCHFMEEGYQLMGKVLAEQVLAELKGGVRTMGTAAPLTENPETVDIIFAGGQSNATKEWASGIHQVLLDSGVFSNLRMVHAYHPGHWLRSWHDDNGTAEDFDADFYNNNKTGALEMAWREVLDSGKQPRLAGFFWLQGEGDTGSLDSQATYIARFNRILSLLQARFELDAPPNFAVAIIDANQKSEFDAALAKIGRTDEMVDRMCAKLIQLGTQTNGVAVDTRGVRRVDVWHLPRPERERLGKDMARTFVQKFY